MVKGQLRSRTELLLDSSPVVVSKVKYQIVIQWSATSMAGYDKMISIEDMLIANLSGGSEVDGHDAGSEEVNIFILTNDVHHAFSEIKSLLAACSALRDARIGYLEVGQSEYSVLWPEGLQSFSVA